MKFIALAAVATSLMAVAPASAATTVGTGNTENCYPFSCFANDGGIRFQQVYNSAALTGLTSFDSISFFRSSGNGLTNSATYNISFSQTSRSSATLSSDLDSNVTGQSSVFGTFTINGSVPSVLTFRGNTFNYDALVGNLLMDVTVTNVTSVDNAYETFFAADGTLAQTARAYQTGFFGSGAGASGLVTRFDQEVAAVPEPATWAMMIMGFGLIGFGMRYSTRKSNAKFDLKVKRIAAGLEA